MERNDFQKGQTVWLLLTEWRAHKGDTLEDRIKEYEVVSVGNKYITVRPKGVDYKGAEVKFSIERDFEHVTKGDPTYVLYLSKDDILKKNRRTEMQRIIRKAIVLDGMITLYKMSNDDFEQIAGICKKYL